MEWNGKGMEMGKKELDGEELDGEALWQLEQGHRVVARVSSVHAVPCEAWPSFSVREHQSANAGSQWNVALCTNTSVESCRA